MQTFLPVELFWQSAALLDNRRLGKQRVETFQIYNVLMGIDKFGQPKDHKGWVNHPAVLMWKGYELALVEYGIEMCKAWIAKGFNDNLYDKFLSFRSPLPTLTIYYPPWLGVPEFHISHKSNLIRKDPEYYIPLFGVDIPDDIPYWWPTKEMNNAKLVL